MHKISFIYANTSLIREDLYQEITLQLWKSYPSFRNESAFSTWMYKVALNTAISFTKKTFLPENGPKDEPSYEMEDDTEYSEKVRTLYKAISRLKKVEKAIILLWLEERSYDEIAATIGISVKNVSVKLVRIKEKLSDMIKSME